MSTPASPPERPEARLRYQVTGAMVVAKSTTPQGVRLQNFYRHAVLPQDVPEKQIAMFLRRRLVVEIDEKGVPVKTEAPAAPAASTRPVRAAKTTGG
jgi:hypothetical protein